MKFKIIFFFTISFLLISCKFEKEENVENYIEVYAIEPGIHCPFSIDCDMIRGEYFSKNRKYYKITDQKFIKEFLAFYCSYKPLDKPNGNDNRIQIFVHQKNKVDTLCLGEHFFTHINGKRMKDLPKLLKLVKDKINYENY